MTALRPRPSTLGYVLVALLATAPAWIVPHPPLQDLPVHLATLRLIHSIDDPAFGFSSVYRTDLLGTEYLLYYLVGHGLAYALGVKLANVAAMSLYLGGLPLAMRALLRALGRDPRLSLLVVPLTVNVMFCFGLLPFVFGFPLMLLGFASAVRHYRQPTLASGAALGALTVLCFYAHVLPFAILGAGCLALFPWAAPRRWPVAAAPSALGLGLVAWWVLRSPAGGNALASLRKNRPFAPLGQALRELPRWSTDIFRDLSDEWLMAALLVLVVVALGFALADRKNRPAPLPRGWGLIPLGCLVAYLSLGDMLGIVWMFGQRFAVPAILTAIPLLRFPRGRRGQIATAAAAVLAVASTVNVCWHFREFERREASVIGEAIAAMQPRKRVAGLIFDQRSEVMAELFAPCLHFVSYYQVEKGGVVQFAYTGFPHWPAQYLPGQFPPPGKLPRLRWEWIPERVPLAELFPWYDYVLTRGDGFRPPPGTFHAAWRGIRWTVWARDGS